MAYQFNNKNPKGIKRACDCVAQAISKALSIPWETAIRDLTELGISIGRVFNEKHTFDKYLTQRGCVKHRQPRKPNGKKYTVKEFCKLEPTGTFVVSVASHLTMVEDGVCYDTWDCTFKTVGNYWKVQNNSGHSKNHIA